jgi:Fe-S-cluster containining protein
MATIPGKSCGSCTMCCKVLVIDHFEKDAGVLCQHCAHKSGCTIYETRPDVCRDYECDWKLERAIGPLLRPDRTNVILQEDEESDDYQAVVDPATPMAWRTNALVFKFLVSKAKEGRTVIAKAGLKSWRIFDNGQYAPWT